MVGSSTLVELTDPESHAIERPELTPAVHDFGTFQDILVTYGNEICPKRSGFFPVVIARASRVTREIVRSHSGRTGTKRNRKPGV